MNFHEYQAKELFAQYGLPVPAGQIATTAEAAVEAARKLGGEQWVVKAQIHAGGRGKAGGVKLCKTLAQVKAGGGSGALRAYVRNMRIPLLRNARRIVQTTGTPV